MSDFLKGKDLRVEIGGTVAQQNNASEHWGWGWDWDSEGWRHSKIIL